MNCPSVWKDAAAPRLAQQSVRATATLLTTTLRRPPPMPFRDITIASRWNDAEGGSKSKKTRDIGTGRRGDVTRPAPGDPSKKRVAKAPRKSSNSWREDPGPCG